MYIQTSFDFSDFADITARNHKGSATSRDANKRIAPSKAKIRNAIVEYARTVDSLTVKDVRKALNLEHQTASARLTELKRDKVLVLTDETREGCGVLKLNA